VIANLLGACYEPNTGYRGLIPNMPLYGYSLSTDEMNTSSLIEAIKNVINWNVDIISISMGTNKENDNLQKVILNAVHRGIVVVCSAGNNPYDVNYPASYPIPGVISVGAIGNDYNILSYTNANSQVDIYAPGENIVSLTDNNTKVISYSGTSVAVPFVTLACIYIKAFSPSLNPAEVENFLIQQANNYLAQWRNEQREIKVLNMEQLVKSLNI
jgi:subtilisin